MRIGLDLTPLPAQPVGAGVYMLRLVRAMAAHLGEHTLVVIHQPDKRALIEAEPLPGVEWVAAPALRPALRLAWEQLSLPGLARRLRLDLLHSLHYTRPYQLPCASVVTFHDMTFFLYPHLHTRARRLYFPGMMRMSARRADALIAVSESTRRDIVNILHIPPEKVHITPLGIGEEFHPIHDVPALEDCRRRYQLPERFILYVGTVEPRKNLPQLLRAYAQAQAATHLPLVIVGRQGWMFEEVYRLVDELGLGERVRFTGYVPAADLPMVYNLAQVFVYPSLYEGFGFPPLEAMACGTPVISTAVSAMQDQLGEAGWLIPPGDEAALCAALDRLAQEAALQQSLSERGLQRAAEFTWSQTARRTLEVYWEVLRPSRSG